MAAPIQPTRSWLFIPGARAERFAKARSEGLSSAEWGHALIGLAHPDFRDELREAAKAQHPI